MLVIRLARTGRNKYPTYRIVAAESARAATGRFVEILGHYNPHTKEISLKLDRIADRLKHGAQPSDTVAKLLTREKVEMPAWVKVAVKADKKAIAATAAAEAAAVEAKAAEVTEAEAAADADASGVTEEEIRVAETAEEQAVAEADKAPNIDQPETAV